MSLRSLFSVNKPALPKAGLVALLCFLAAPSAWSVAADERCPLCAGHANRNEEPSSVPPTIVHIQPGLSCIQIIRLLREKDIVRSSMRFGSALFLSGNWRKLKAGNYCFRNDIDETALIRVLTEGRVMLHRICIPEGWSIKQVMQCVSEHPCLQGAMPEGLAEGSVLPGTYLFTDGQTRRQCLVEMQQALHGVLRKACANLTDKNRTPASVLIMASIVEKETSITDEKPVIAGIFWNRIQKGMRLQADPTIIYALQANRSWRPPLLRSDLRVESPYNTYRKSGLPPTPICCPSKASILAAAHAPKTHFLYFNATKNHRHLFAATLTQHNHNVQKVRRGE